MSYSTLSELRIAARDWLNRSNITDARLDDCIRAVEDYINTQPEFRTADNEVTVQATDITGICLPGPSDMLEVRKVYDDTGRTYHLVTPDDFSAQTYLKSTEYFYSLVALEFSLNPAPVDRTISIVYWAKVPHLTNAAPSNWLLTKYPSIYLFGVLWFSTKFGFDDARAAGWEKDFNRFLSQLFATSWNLRAGSAPIKRRANSRYVV